MSQKKRSFIPLSHRPSVPGSKLKEPQTPLIDGLHSTQNHFECSVILSAKTDIVPAAFLKEINGESLRRLFYDDLGILWDFTFHQGVLTFIIPEGNVTPVSIYHRHPGVAVTHDHYKKHIAFFEVLDLWGGNLIGQRRDHHHNSSKAYQAVTSIRQANNPTNPVKHPKSFFIKGSNDVLNSVHFLHTDMIVKSCSNIRSQVVSQEEFGAWDTKNLKSLPTLFQEKINGKDIRVHICEDTQWALLVDSKDATDYRYASKGSIRYQEVFLPENVQNFCYNMAAIEKNRLVGVDLMKIEDEYFCLESNPGPGWSTFNHTSKKKFANHIFATLVKQ